MSETAKFTWIPFYEEFALKLLEFIDNRSELVKKIKEINPERIHFITAKTPDGDFHDIDPFSVFAIFNRSSNIEKRQEILNTIRRSFNLQSTIPENFDAIPLVNAQKACFYYEDEKSETIPLLWNLFKAFMDDKIDDIKDLFDKAQKRKGIRWNLTMAFFWMKPKEYMPLDAKSRNFIQNHLTIKLFSDSRLNGENYLSCIKKIKEASNENFAVLSNKAWLVNEKMEVNGLMVQDSSSDWPDDLIKDMDGDVRPGSFWWHENPVGKGDTIKLLRDKLKEDGSFDFYIFRNRKAIYKAIVTDFVCSQEEYSTKIEDWKSKNTQWLKESFAEFNDFDGKRTAKILFYVEEMEKLENPISMDDFVTSKNFKKPHITKLVPFKRVNIAGNFHSEDEEMDISTYVKLLEANHNIILHGAPGTGKTYLAKEIASAMIFGKSQKSLDDDEKSLLTEQIGFVQFHQSYDYTDFVEGLRPANGENGKADGFEHKDGVFKKFCTKALSSRKINDVDNFEEIYRKLIEELNEKELVEIKSRSGGKFAIALNATGNGLILLLKKDGEYKQTSYGFFNYDQCYKVYQGFPGVPRGGLDNYRKAIVDHMKDNMGLKEYVLGQIATIAKPFVFIIDEINRGEISKIFGELFFSIDPGYRGENGRINTQYQNLVEEGDTFENGFFVPENVYIIGTMNDIDRSVESMDFAMRRRFAFKEIKASDRIEMLKDAENGIGVYAEDAEKRMNALNAAIENVPGLSSAYHIGPAYFLKLKNYINDSNPFNSLWEYHIEGIIKEYLRGIDPDGTHFEALKKAYDEVAEG